MKISVMHQEKYSLGELLLRSFFGFIYIGLPHLFLLMFYSIYVVIAQVIAFFSVLFTRTYPRFAFEAVTGYLRWNFRVNVSLSNLVDGYPPFGPSERWNKADFDIAYPTVVTRKRMLFAAFLGSFVTIPQLFWFYIRAFVTFFIYFIAFFSVLFTRDYPEDMHRFVVGTYRIEYRVILYFCALYFKYPEFDAEETEVDRMHA